MKTTTRESETETNPPLGGTSRRPTLDRALAPYPPPAPTVDTTDEGGTHVEGAKAEAVATAAVALAARFRILARFGIPPPPPVNMLMVSLGIFALALHANT
jgi:hypothetical protein